LAAAPSRVLIAQRDALSAAVVAGAGAGAAA